MGRRFGVLLIALCAAAGIASPDAGAQQTPDRLVTFVARVCDSYADVAANRARNNIQESLRDLGVDSAYQGGDMVVPSIEQQQSPNCRPLVDWPFTMGPGYLTRADEGPWGSLSKVTDPFDAPPIRTQAETPLLDRNGDPTGTNIAGAVTIALTRAQADLASRSALWVQGGVPGDPVLERVHPGRYGFAALRCGIDALNGDNVEWIGYPTGARHVFCYAYYVTPPPTSGRIVVRKELDAPSTAADETYTFRGNISYTPDHVFTLRAGPGRPASETFYRAAGQTWSFAEDGLPGYVRTSLACTSATGASATTTDLASGATSVDLGPGDTVTCTYVNGLAPPPAGLVLAKRTLGGVGTFGFAVTGPEDRRQTITTTQESVAFTGDPLELSPGAYAIHESLPEPGPAGTWSLRSAECNGQARSARAPVSVDLSPGQGATCLFTNEFTPAGAIVVRKRSEGRTGRVAFLIRRVSTEHPDTYQQVATTTQQGVAVRARGDDTSSIPLGTYDLVELNPATAGGSWELSSVLCDGVPVGAAQGRAQVRLTREHPTVDCTFVDRFRDRPEPENPSNPPGEVQGAGAAAGPLADLRVTKTVTPRVARPGQRVRYRIVATNVGPDTAYDVVGTDVLGSGAGKLRLRLSAGRANCTRVRPVRCTLGALRRGQRVVLTATTVAPSTPGQTVNRVAVSTSTHEERLSNNRARATLVVRRPVPPPVTG